MRNARSLIIALALIALAVTALYPPWLYKDSESSAHGRPMGYSFVWQPPVREKRASADIFGLSIDVKLDNIKANAIDVETLFKNWLLIAGVAFAAFAVTSFKPMRRAT